ncbi:MAG: hypothetical protein JSW71_19035 [Gemmatimonadota bacterium]|nr:MAG: hypothetical protein JSW71_19035 [Gemmatimonadota bacterium]
MRVKGRIWLAGWLVFTLVVLAWVVTRDAAGYATARHLDSLRTRKAVLQAQRAELIRQVRRAGSRAVLVPRARELGLRPAADSQIIILRLPDPERN